MVFRVRAGLLELVVALLLLAPWIDARQKGDLVADAIADGLARQIEPYLLRQNLTPNLIVGVIYTPYVRVARFARAAHEQGRLVQPDDIPDAVKAPVVYVAMRTLKEDRSNGVQPFRLAAILRPPTALPPERSAYFVPQNLQHPLRLESVKTASVAIGRLPYKDIDLIGIFSESLTQRPWVEFCVFQEYTSEQGTPAHSVTAGYVAGPLR